MHSKKCINLGQNSVNKFLFLHFTRNANIISHLGIKEKEQDREH